MPFKRYARNARWKLSKHPVAQARAGLQKTLVRAFATLARKVGYSVHTGDYLVIKRAAYQIRPNGSPELVMSREDQRVEITFSEKKRRVSSVDSVIQRAGS